MRKKYRNRKKAQLRKAGILSAQSFSQFIDSTNERVVGRSPSVLPVMEDLLRDAVPPLPAPCERQQKHSTEETFVCEFNDQADTVVNGELHARLRLMKVKYVEESHVRSARALSFPWQAIPITLMLLVAPILLFCAVKLQTHEPGAEAISPGQSKHRIAAETEFSKVMDEGALAEVLGDNDEAIARYAKAALQPMSQNDRTRLYSALNSMEKKIPSNPNVQIAFGNYFETNGQFLEAEKAYTTAAQLSLQH